MTGALALLAGCATSGAPSVTRVNAPAPSATTAPPAPPTVSLATVIPATVAPATVVPTTVAATIVASTTVAPATVAPVPTTAAPVVTDPPTTVPIQNGPLLEAAPPLAAPIVAVGGSSSRPDVFALQQRLLNLGFWVPDTDGSYGWVTQQAVTAFQKYNGLDPTGTADQQTTDLLNIAPYRALALGWEKDMIEVDQAKQVLFVVQGGRTVWTFNTSTGAGGRYAEPNKRKPGETVTGIADTPQGVFQVYSEQPNGWWKGDLGELYRPKFFKGGAAVHGAPKVPNFPASHGCVRVTPDAMDFIWTQNYMPKGMTVWVHT